MRGVIDVGVEQRMMWTETTDGVIARAQHPPFKDIGRIGVNGNRVDVARSLIVHGNVSPRY